MPMEGQFRGGNAFLMANGPSVGALDLTPLHRRWVMTLNNGAKTFRGNATCTVDEPSRFSLSMWLDPTLMKFAPMSHFEKPLWDNRLVWQGCPTARRGTRQCSDTACEGRPSPSACGSESLADSATAEVEDGWVQRWEQSKLKLGDCPNVIGYRRNEKFHAPRWLNEETINWGNHGKWGGGRSVLLAALRILFLLGFRKVYLVGVDFDMSDTKRYHFEEGRTPNAIKGNQSTYKKLQAWLTELQPLFLKAGYVVRNCNPASKLTAFPFISYEDALAESGAQLGDITRERTEGMYTRAADAKAAKEKAEPAASSGTGGQTFLSAEQEAEAAVARVSDPRETGERTGMSALPVATSSQAQIPELEEQLQGENASEACASELFEAVYGGGETNKTTLLQAGLQNATAERTGMSALP